MINEQGGVNGRKINFISLDDGYSPPKTVEQVRRLVEQEHVAFLANTLGTAQNAAIRQYLNDNKVPQLFVLSGAPMFADPKHFPWTMLMNPSYVTEAHIYAKHILATRPDAKLAVLYQNDDFGKGYLNGLRDVLGPDRVGMIVKETSYEVSEPTVDSQVVTLQGSGADLFLIAATPKFAAQAIRKSADLGWSGDPLSQLCLSLRRRGAETRWPRKVEGAHHCNLRHRRDGPAMERHSRHAGLEGVHRQVHVGDRLRRRPRVGRLWQRGDGRAGAEAMRERPVA